MRDLIVEPPLNGWAALVERCPERARSRAELGLPTDRPIVATGHQTLLWHPGILAKYLAVQAMADATGVATANLVVDQHADGFGSFAAPARLSDGALTIRRLPLATERRGVPMALHEPFAPSPPPRWRAALPSVERGVERIYASVGTHRDAPNAARQMAGALADLMSPWVKPMPDVTASELLEASLGRTLLEKMADDPWGCAESYNRAVAACPQAGVTPLLVRDDYVELPVWRARDTGERMRGYDADVQRWLESPARAPRLFPRALLLTALVRLCMCDLFVHGTGGARYDCAMEGWIRDWLGLEPAPIAVVSATLRLPLGGDRAEAGPGPGPGPDPDADAAAAAAAARYRRLWHDPGPGKRELLDAVNAAPRGTPQRRARFHEMHAELERLRAERAGDLERARRAADDADRRRRERPIVESRTWPFPLYEPAAIDALAATLSRLSRSDASPRS